MRESQQSSARQGSAQFKRGVIEKIDEKLWRARVKFEDEDGVQSFWLSIAATGAKGNRHAHTHREGEQVACLVDWRGEDGVIVGGLYSEMDERPESAKENYHVEFEDGAVHEHDPKTKTHRVQMKEGKLFLSVKEARVHIADGKVFLSSGQTRLLITDDGIIVSRPITLSAVDDIPVPPVRKS